MFFPQKPT